jgi:hypothetical protein
MLCPNLATQGQLIGESTEGLAFAFLDCGGEYKNIGANAKPLQICVYGDLRALMIHDINEKTVPLIERYSFFGEVLTSLKVWRFDQRAWLRGKVYRLRL